MQDNANGHKFTWWIIGLLTTVAMAGGTGLAHTVLISAQRIASLEANYENLEKQISRIDTKIDRLLERGKP